MNDKEFLETLSKEQIIDLYLVMDAGYKNEMEELNNQNLSMTIFPQDLNNTSLNSEINS